eukprot:gene1359-1554_t
MVNGTYKGPDNIGIVIKKSINIQANDLGNITIDCEGAGYGLKIQGVNYFGFSNLVIQNCVSGVGGGIAISNSSGILANIVFRSNQASLGGGLYVSNSNLRLVSPTLLNNQALDSGAGIHTSGSLLKFLGNTITISNNTITDILNQNQMSGRRPCGQDNPNHNFSFCYRQIAKNCPLTTPPPGHLNPGFNIEEDTLGDMISNQFLWNLPGSEHFNFGINIFNLKEGLSPLFRFDYCSNTNTDLMEDPYRSMVYQVPPSLNAKAMPICTYSTSSTVYSSAQEMSQDLASSASLSTSASVDVEGIAASVAFSGEASVNTAKKLTCSSTFIEMDTSNINFALGFLHDLANLSIPEDMFGIFNTYGTYYYKSSMMGGKLTQLTSISESLSDSTKSSEYSASATAKFGTSVNEPGLGKASGSVGANVGGGMPAAFAPSTSSSPNTYSAWTSSVDLLPVPYDPQLAPIMFQEDPKISGDIDICMKRDILQPQKLLFPPKNDLRLNITWYPISADKPEYFSVPLVYQHTDIDWKIRDFEFPNNSTNDGTKFPVGLQSGQIDSDSYDDENLVTIIKNTTFGDMFTYDLKSIINPVAFEFVGPNLMTSVISPVINIIGFTVATDVNIDMDVNYGETFHSYLLAWETGEAIIFDQNGIHIFEPNEFSVQVMFEQARTSKLEVCATKSGCTIPSCSGCVTNTLCDSENCCGAFVFTVGPDSPIGKEYLSYADRYYNAIYDISWYNYYHFKGKIEDGNLTTLGFSNIKFAYSQFRIDWVLGFFSQTNGPNWKVNVTTFNIIDSNRDFWTDTKESFDTYDLLPMNSGFSRSNYPFHNYNYPIQGNIGSVNSKFYLSEESD